LQLTTKVPQARSLPDPMFMTGYQNEGWKKYTYGEMLTPSGCSLPHR
jgi:hypothetical protein